MLLQERQFKLNFIANWFYVRSEMRFKFAEFGTSTLKYVIKYTYEKHDCLIKYNMHKIFFL